MSGPSEEFLADLDRTISILRGLRDSLPLTTAEQDADSSTVSGLLGRYIGQSVDWYDSRCAVAQCAPATPEALAAQLVTSMLAPNLMRSDFAGEFARVDTDITAFLAELFEVGKDPAGLSSYSGSAALYYGIRAAVTEARLGGPSLQRICIVTGPHGHSSLEKIASFVGLSRGSVLRFGVDQLRALGGYEGRRLLRGYHVAAIVGTFGSTDTAENDDFRAITQVRRELAAIGHSARLVVDAVLSWPMLSLHRIDVTNTVGIDMTHDDRIAIQAMRDELGSVIASDGDYFAVDFHKWSGTPLGSAFLLLRDRRNLSYLLPSRMSYYDAAEVATLESPHELVIDTTRSAAGPIAALANLRNLGMKGLAETVTRSFLLARQLTTEASAAGWRTLPANPSGPIVCVTPPEDANVDPRWIVNRLAELCQSAGGLTGSVRRIGGNAGGTDVARFCFVNPRLTAHTVEATLQQMRSLARLWLG